MTDTTAGAHFDSETAASRASAFVYGNILVLAALVALSPGQLTTGRDVAYVLGTGLSTFIAHVVGESVGDRIRHGNASGVRFRAHVRNSVPIASSASVPAALLAAAWIGSAPGDVALASAQTYTIGRVAFLGTVIGHYHGDRSVRATFAGVALAAVCAVAAAIKWLLTH